MLHNPLDPNRVITKAELNSLENKSNLDSIVKQARVNQRINNERSLLSFLPKPIRYFFEAVGIPLAIYEIVKFVWRNL